MGISSASGLSADQTGGRVPPHDSVERPSAVVIAEDIKRRMLYPAVEMNRRPWDAIALPEDLIRTRGVWGYEKVSDACCLVRPRERTGLGSGFFPVWITLPGSILPLAGLSVFYATRTSPSANITQASQHQGS